MWRKDLAYLFPIRSQTSANDRYWLIQLLEHARGHNREYRYVEIGSYIGGTLTPALLDESCVDVLSIDLRPKTQPDSRNALFDYSHISTTTMLNELKTQGFSDVAKLTTFDGRAGDCDFKGRKYQMAFIDAEHTDEAVFRDFIAVYDHLEKTRFVPFTIRIWLLRAWRIFWRFSVTSADNSGSAVSATRQFPRFSWMCRTHRYRAIFWIT